MHVAVTVGDVLGAEADILISTANPWLNMSGGVNGAIRERDPSIQTELYDYLEAIGKPALPAGSVVRTSAGTLPFLHIVHAIAIDPFYDSSRQIVAVTLTAAFKLAASLHAESVALPTLATGYGPLTVEEFALAFTDCQLDRSTFQSVNIVVRSAHHAATINKIIASSS